MSADGQATLLERLCEAELLEPAQLEELAKLPEASDPDPRALGRVLLQRKLLTRFQINQAALGKGKELRVGKFLLLDKLGEGGMGQVYKAKDTRMGRLVALKLMRKEKLAKPESVKRFYQEIQAASQLNHPNIVIAYDADQVGNLHYFSMELVDGIDLARQIKDNGPLPIALACEYVRQAAVGLQHAHEKGLVHRDIKPANLLVANNSGTAQVKILDMGLARLQGQGETGLTQAGQVLGTPDYLAPEQAFDSRKADVRSDIYSLGCTLYYLLCGQPPFTGETLTQILLKHQMEEAIALAQRRSEVPAALAAVVRKMMAKVPDDRYQSAAEVADTLAPFARGETGSRFPVAPVAPVAPAEQTTDDWATLAGDEDRLVVRPSSARTRGATEIIEADDRPRRGRRRQEEEAGTNRTLLYILLGAGAAIPVLGIMVLAVVLLSRPAKQDREDDQAKAAQLKTNPAPKPPVRPPDPGLGAGQKPPPKAQQNDIFDAIAEAVRAGKTARTTPAPLRPAGREEFVDVPPEGALLTGLELGLGKFVGNDVVQAVRPIYQTRTGRVLGKQHGRELPRVVTVEAKPGYAIGALDVRAGAGLDAVTVTFMAIEGRRLNPARSYRSEQVGGNGGIGPFPLSGGGAPVVGIFGRIWNANARQLGLVIVSDTPAPPPIDTPGRPPIPKGALVGTFGGHQPQVKQVILSPDGRQALSLDSLTVRLWDVRSPVPVRSFKGHQGTITEMAVSKDWRWLLTGGADGTVRLWDLGTGEQARLFQGAGGESTHCVALSEDGRYAASGHGVRRTENRKRVPHDTVVRLWDLQSGKEVSVFRDHTWPLASVTFSSDSKSLVSVDSSLPVYRVWDVERRRPLHSASSPANLRNMRVIPLAEPRDVVFIGRDGSLHLCNLDTPRRAYLLSGNPRMKTVFLARDARRALTAGDGVVRLVEIPSGKELARFGTPSANLSVSLSADSRFALTGGNDGTMRLWDLTKLGVEAGEPVKAEGGSELARLDLKPNTTADLALGPKGQTLVFGSRILGVVNPVDGKLLRSIPVEAGVFLLRLAVAPDERHVLAGCSDHRLRLFDTTDEKVVRTFEGHTSNLHAVAVSPDGEWAASAAGGIDPNQKRIDCTVRIWEMKTGKLRHTLEGFTSLPRGVAFSPDSKQVIAIGWPSELRVWSVADGKPVKTAKLSDNPNGPFSLSRDGKRLLYPGAGAFILWDIDQDRQVQRLPIPRGSNPMSVAFCGDRHAVTGSGGYKFEGNQLVRDSNNRPIPIDCLVRLWDLETGTAVKRFAGHEHFVRQVVCSPDGRRAYSASVDNTLRIWDLSDSLSVTPPAAPVVAFKGHEGTVNALAVSRDGKHVLTGGADGTVRLWDAAGQEVKRYTGLRGAINSVGFSANGQRVIACDATGALQVWEFISGNRVRSSRPVKQDNPAHTCLIVPDGSAYVLSRGKSLSTGRLVGASSTRSTTLRADIRALACSADSSRLAVGDEVGSVRLADPDTLKQTPLALPHRGAVLALAFAPSGTALVSAGADKWLLWRDLRTGRARKFVGHNAAVYAVDVSPDGKWVVSGSKDTTVRLWEAATGRQVELYSGHKGAVLGVAFDPRGKRILSCGDSIRVWDLPDKVVIKSSTP
jgi:WD40 repeat protein/serine/threonine protein kinase